MILLRLMIPVTFSYLVIRFPLFVFGDFLESFKKCKVLTNFPKEFFFLKRVKDIAQR